MTSSIFNALQFEVIASIIDTLDMHGDTARTQLKKFIDADTVEHFEGSTNEIYPKAAATRVFIVSLMGEQAFPVISDRVAHCQLAKTVCKLMRQTRLELSCCTEVRLEYQMYAHLQPTQQAIFRNSRALQFVFAYPQLFPVSVRFYIFQLLNLTLTHCVEMWRCTCPLKCDLLVRSDTLRLTVPRTDINNSVDVLCSTLLNRPPECHSRIRK
jgi:hypothetical protein